MSTTTSSLTSSPGQASAAGFGVAGLALFAYGMVTDTAPPTSSA